MSLKVTLLFVCTIATFGNVDQISVFLAKGVSLTKKRWSVGCLVNGWTSVGQGQMQAKEFGSFEANYERHQGQRYKDCYDLQAACLISIKKGGVTR